MLTTAEKDLAEYVAQACITNHFEALLIKLDKIDDLTQGEILKLIEQLQAAKKYPEQTFGNLDDDFSQIAYNRAKDICRLIIRTRLTKLKKQHTILTKQA